MYVEETKKEMIKRLFRGSWFHSSWTYNEAIPELVKEGFMKPLSDLVGNIPAAKYWYVDSCFTMEDLTKVFTTFALNCFGVYKFNLDYNI